MCKRRNPIKVSGVGIASKDGTGTVEIRFNDDEFSSSHCPFSSPNLLFALHCHSVSISPLNLHVLNAACSVDLQIKIYTIKTGLVEQRLHQCQMNENSVRRTYPLSRDFCRQISDVLNYSIHADC